MKPDILKLGRTSAGPIVRLRDRWFSIPDPKYTGIEGFASLMSLGPDELFDFLFAATRGEAMRSEPRFQTFLDPSRTPILGAGVTYSSSLRERRLEVIREGGTDSVNDDGRSTPYDIVYDTANPPEIFHKAYFEGHLAEPDQIWIRPDGNPDGGMGSSVPEPERALFVNAAGEIVAEGIGCDTTARQLESQCPLYLPAAKTYPGCVTLCPFLTVFPPGQEKEPAVIRMEISREGEVLYSDRYTTGQMKRSVDNIVRQTRTMAPTITGRFPFGFLLLTGTGIIPSIEFSLQEGDRVLIDSPQLGQIDAITQVARYRF